jgi:hypothetical protein
VLIAGNINYQINVSNIRDVYGHIIDKDAQNGLYFMLNSHLIGGDRKFYVGQKPSWRQGY